MWRAFGQAVTSASAEAASESFDARVIQGAKDTFDAFERWLRQETSEFASVP
jgi:heme oxygenase